MKDLAWHYLHLYTLLPAQHPPYAEVRTLDLLFFLQSPALYTTPVTIKKLHMLL